jgi:hypothetical protein
MRSGVIASGYVALVSAAYFGEIERDSAKIAALWQAAVPIHTLGTDVREFIPVDVAIVGPDCPHQG